MVQRKRLPFKSLLPGVLVLLVLLELGVVGAVAMAGWLGQHAEDQAWLSQLASIAMSVPPADNGIVGYARYSLQLYPGFAFVFAALWLMPLVALIGCIVQWRLLRIKAKLFRARGELVESTENLHEAQKRLRLNEQQLSDVRDQTAKMHERISDSFVLLNPSHEVVYFNRHAKRFFVERTGHEGEEILGQPLESIMPGYDESDLKLTVNTVLSNKRPRTVEAHLMPEDVWVAANIYPSSGGAYVYFQDITRQKNANVKVQASISLLRQVIDAAPASTAITDTNWNYLAVNRSWLNHFKLDADQCIGLNHGAVLPDTMADLPEISAVVQQGDVYEAPEKPYRVAGREEWVHWEVRPWWDDDDRFSGYLLTANFTTEDRLHQQRVQRQREQERRLAYHDSLTGLPNRQLFYDRLNQSLAQAYRNMNWVALMFLDLDGFKAVNDKLGHDVGDMLLKEVAMRLQACVRNSDTVSRLGGDEFTVILSGISSAEDATHVAQKIVSSISQPYTLGTHQNVRVTTSVGVSLYPNDAATAVDLIKAADATMYTAKQSGKNQFRFHAKVEVKDLSQEGGIEQRIREGIKNNEFELHYQPQVDATTRKIYAVEALVRWQHPRHGLLKPENFLPEAEETKAIFELGDWILNEACRQNRAWRDQGHELQVTVNLSPRQFRHKELTASVKDTLAAYKLPPGALGLEMTEAIVMENAKTTLETLNALKMMGVELIIDDFGTSFTSMSRLRNFPLDTLKIHQSFIHRMDESPEDQGIVRTIITLAHNLQLKVVGEGVETAEQAEFLTQNGCNFIQGFLLGHPVKPSKVAGFLDGGVEGGDI